MLAYTYKKHGLFQLEEKEKPVLLAPSDAIVRVTLASICTSDLHIKHGAVPRAVPGTILGHEFVGIVEKVGSAVCKVKPGDRVAVNVEIFCGECFYCRQGFVNNCTDPNGGWALGCRIDGGQAEYARIPYADNGLTRIPEHVTDEQALFTGDILSTGYWGAKIGEIKPADTVLVIGAGPTGLCTMMCAGLYSPSKIIALDTDESRLQLAKKAGLADIIWNPQQMTEKELEMRIKEVSHGRGADTVFEVAGGRETFQLAWKLARPNGIVAVIAMYEEDQIIPLPQMYGKNLTFKTGGVDGSDCERIMELIADGKIDTTCLITHRMSFTDILKGYEIFENKEDGAIKIAVKL